MVKVILPCAGFGTRMGMKSNESKEMLIEPSTGEPVIEYSLKLCSKYGLTPCIISRREKTDLNDYLFKKGIRPQIINPVGEWMDTVLLSSGFWNQHNILILPDTRFEPTNILQKMVDSLSLGVKTVLGLHMVTDSSKWGIVSDYSIIEKPSYDEKKWAWGLIGFHIDTGTELFSGMRNKGTVKLNNASFLYLNKFKDITRTGKLDE